jgi:phosphoribosylcarboxyaminoimidazole (NCAIR) mutase
MDARVAYYLQGKDKTIYFTSEGLTYVLSERSAGEEIAEKTASVKERLSINPAEHELRSRRDQRRFAVKLDFVGANADVRPSGEEKTGAVISYFKGKPEEWKAGLPTYSRIVYKNLWPGIDVAYYGTVDKMKYEFVVHPGSDPSLIRLAYRGASAVELNGEGRLKVRTPAGGFEDDRPVGYQEINGDRVDVAMSYLLEEQSAKDAGPGGQEAVTKSYVYGFEVGDYDRTKPLVLDPAVLFYCGYIGGSLGDGGAGIAVDSMGNAYITGSTSSTEATFPVFGGPDLTNNGNGDAFVAKVNASGTALVYCGYIGGSDYDRGFAIAVDGSGNAYVTGRTWSAETTFPVIGGPDLTHNGGEDAFVAKVNASGTALVYCGYVGGGDWDEGYGIAVDGSGNVYVAGYTESTEATFPAIGGPDLTYNGGRFDAFVAKVNASGTALVYCGYIGGSGDDWGYAIAVDGSGNAYITGFTNSTQATFPVIGGLDLTHNGGEDAFVAKVNASGTALVYCGYIGGGDWDEGYGIAVDGSGNAYVAGNTSSTEATFPVLYGPDLTQNGSYDAFVAKVNASGTALVYCGYIGGSDWDEGYGIAVDGSGNAYVTGRTWSAETTFPVIGGPDLTFNGNDDAFVAKVNASGAALVYCGYIGGSLNDMGYGIAVDSTGNAYATGSTFSTAASFPVIGGPDLTYNGYSDAFVAKISPHKPELTIQSSQYGTTNPSPGVYYYATGTRVQVTAIPNTNCEFVNWSGDISSTQNPVTVTMNGNKTIEANFRLQPKLTIQSSANGTTDPVPGVYAYPLNVVVQVTAVPATYSDFISWTGDATGAANPVSVTMNRDKSILANFRYIYAPTASGVKVLNRSFSQAEYINILSWEAIPANAGLDITKYKIYLVNNGTPSLLAEVGADQRQYSHRKAGQQKLDYAIVAVLSSGREGAPVLVTVQ